MPYLLDIIGDVHGELPALETLGRELGYSLGDRWSHPDSRIPVFLGDLVDRGAYSLEVAELVKDLVSDRRAFCIMGNHEYNLVAWYAGIPGYVKPKRSNQATTSDVQRREGRWRPVLTFLRALPVAVQLPDLRIIHACWHLASLKQVDHVLRTKGRVPAAPADAFEWLEKQVVLRSPFNTGVPLRETQLLPGLPGDTSDKSAMIPHEDLMKGYEVPAKLFEDNDGTPREKVRAVWWRDGQSDVLDDRPQVFGHYWNVPPVEGDMAPPHPSGHPNLRAWAASLVDKVPPSGAIPMKGDIACVDFHGVTNVSNRACIGALRWPERQIVWACAAKTSTFSGGD